MTIMLTLTLIMTLTLIVTGSCWLYCIFLPTAKEAHTTRWLGRTAVAAITALVVLVLIGIRWN
jgi:hypothetical protein